MSTYFQFLAMVRVPLGPAPPAAVNASSLTTTLPLASESQIGSLPAVASLRSPIEASGVPSLMESMKLVVSSRSAFSCVHAKTR